MTQVNGDSIFPVLNMLNTKYFILPLQNGQTVPLENPYTYGNAWLVDEVKYADNANEELTRWGSLTCAIRPWPTRSFRDVLGVEPATGLGEHCQDNILRA